MSESEAEKRGTSIPTLQNDPKGHYACLSVRTDASPGEIRKAFLHLSSAYHTDKHQHQQQQQQAEASHHHENLQQSLSDPDTLSFMNERFQRVNDAYQILSDPRSRIAYDHSGDKGVERLALVPASVVNPLEISKFLDHLKREAALNSKAKMLSSTGDVSVQFSIVVPNDPTAALRKKRAQELLRRRMQRQMQHQQQQEKGKEQQVGDAKEPQQQTEQQQDEAVQEQPPNPPQQQPSGPVGVQVREVVLDGKKTIVLIPPENVAEALKQQVGAGAGSQSQSRAGEAETGTEEKKDESKDANVPKAETVADSKHNRELPIVASPSDAQGHPQGAFVADGPGGMMHGGGMMRRRSRWIPLSINATHTFQHPVNRQIALMFAADAHQSNKGVNSVGFGTTAEYHSDNNWQLRADTRLATDTCKFAVIFQRPLTALVDYTAGLTLWDDNMLIPNMYLQMSRKLSQLTALRQTLQMSWLPGGSSYSIFYTRVSPPTPPAQKEQSGESEGEGEGDEKKETEEGGEEHQDGEGSSEAADSDLGGKQGLSLGVSISGGMFAFSAVQNAGMKNHLKWAPKLWTAHVLPRARALESRAKLLQRLTRLVKLAVGDDCVALDVWNVLLAATEDEKKMGGRKKKGDENELWFQKKMTWTRGCRFEPLSGSFSFSYEVWMPFAKLQKFGVGASVLMPMFAPPLKPSLFAAWREVRGGANPHHPISRQLLLLTTFQFLYKRGDHKIAIPVVVSIQPTLGSTALYFLAPYVVLRVALRFGKPLWRVWRRQRSGRVFAGTDAESQEEKQQLCDDLLAARRRAVSEQQTLHSIVEQRRSVEEARKGLVIVNAEYGVLGLPSPVAVAEASGGDDAARLQLPPLTLDVTDALQHYVRDSQLVVAGRPTKSDLTGFYNVAPRKYRDALVAEYLKECGDQRNATSQEREEEGKEMRRTREFEALELRVCYRFKGLRHEVVVRDDEPLELPQEEHLVKKQQQ